MYKKIGGMKTKQQSLFTLLLGISLIFFWRGLWGLLDIYLFPNDFLISSWASLGIGVLLWIIIHYVTKEIM